MSCLQEAETGFMHVTCTALLHKGIWHPKLSCLLKPHHQQVHQRSQDWLSLGVYWTALCTGKDWGLSGAQLTPSKSGAVRYRHASGLILTKEKEKKRLKGLIVISFCFWMLLILSLLIPAFVSCQGWGLHWRAAMWKHTKGLLHRSWNQYCFLSTSAHFNVDEWSLQSSSKVMSQVLLLSFCWLAACYSKIN